MSKYNSQKRRGMRLKVGARKPADKQALREALVLQITRKLHKLAVERGRLNSRLKAIKREMKTSRSALRAALQASDTFEYDSAEPPTRALNPPQEETES